MSDENQNLGRRKSRRLAGLKPDHDRSASCSSNECNLQDSPPLHTDSEICTSNDSSSNVPTSSYAESLTNQPRRQPPSARNREVRKRILEANRVRRSRRRRRPRLSPSILANIITNSTHGLALRYRSALRPENHSSASLSSHESDAGRTRSAAADEVWQVLNASMAAASASASLSSPQDSVGEGGSAESSEQPSTSSGVSHAQARINPFAAQRNRSDRDTGAPLRVSFGLTRVISAGSGAPPVAASVGQGESFCRCSQQSQSRDLTCTCGEDDTAIYDWKWDTVAKSAACEISSDGRDARFHSNYSSGTAAARGNLAMTDRQYFWEIKMTTPVYGTDMMVGVGTASVDLDTNRYHFCSFLGRDKNSWGLSYYGKKQHCGTMSDLRPTVRFGQGSIIGMHLDTWLGRLSFYKNRRPVGRAHIYLSAGALKLKTNSKALHCGTIARGGLLQAPTYPLSTGQTSRAHSHRPLNPYLYVAVNAFSWNPLIAFYDMQELPKGVVFTGLRGLTLYPMVSSTAARTGMRLIKACSYETSLEFLCCSVLRKSVPSHLDVTRALKLPPGLHDFLVNNLSWLLCADELTKVGDKRTYWSIADQPRLSSAGDELEFERPVKRAKLRGGDSSSDDETVIESVLRISDDDDD